MTNKKPTILLTNDDGINSPGLWATAEALAPLGYVWVVAPREQSSGAGRSMPQDSDGIITSQQLNVHGVDWTVYAVGGTPAQAVQHAILEIIDGKPDLIVSGINYGTNLGPGVTVSGTVGAAIEGAVHGIPSMAISLETHKRYHLSHSTEIDFTAAAYFTALIAKKYLRGNFPPEVRLLKMEIPDDATMDTPWEITRLSSERFYIALPPQRDSWDQEGRPGYTYQEDYSVFGKDTDAYALLEKRVVAVTPLSLDMTSRVDLAELDKQLRRD
ncbi:MAG: 5'/3'-nucleotidase SurE [Chloroflexota bacterium]